MANRLAAATSPYLLQHQHNPVDWWEWGPEAFEQARERDVPILLSVGYAACHWCHVMAHESFEDEATAALMNELFVNVKVDREERPDVDATYMAATTALTGHGGWPMTVFLTPDGRPFYAGTYFPPRPAHGMPSFTELLRAVAESWTARRGDVDAAAGRITDALRERATSRVGADLGTPTAERLSQAVGLLQREEDTVHGGFGGAPKFPPSMVCEFLLRHGATQAPTADTATAMAGRTLAAMARSGTYDQVAGGFARYSVDAAWVVPHFEKMLYDNALLARVYLHWWRATGEDTGRRVALEVCDWMLADLLTEQGGLASSLDADTPVDGRSVEGATYVWTPQELVDVLGADDGSWAAELLAVTGSGTFEHGTSTAQLTRDVWAEEDGAARWRSVRDRLRAARAERPQPARDDKVVAAWNGLAVAALAETGALCDRPDLLAAAEKAADLLLAVHLDEHGRLLRASRDGVAGAPAGVLEDYGDVAEGLLTLHAVTGEKAWADVAGALLDVVLTEFTDQTGGLLDTSAVTADPALEALGRSGDPTDNATPSGSSAAAGALLTWSALTGSTRHREAAERALRPVDALGGAAPRFAGWGLAVAEAALAGPLQVAVVGPAPDDAAGMRPGADGQPTGAQLKGAELKGAELHRAELHRAALEGTSPGLVVSACAEDVPETERLPLLQGRSMVAGAAAAYVCRGFVCELPTTDVTALRHQVGSRS